MEYADLLDLDTWYAVRKAAPKIAQVPYDSGQLAAKSPHVWGADGIVWRIKKSQQKEG